MCGIAGIVNFRHPENSRELVGNMLDHMPYRGPDASGIYVSDGVTLGHTRLSIIDLSGGDQPIHNEDRTVWITFNGEIFNYPELREDLLGLGHRFYTASDTEVLVHLYEEYGTKMLDRLNGQFAFAIWDENRETLFMARDRVGIRPLFYHHDNGRLVFASEIKAILADKSLPRMLESQTLSDIFTCWTPVGGLTAFKDVFQVPAGHYALFSKSGFSLTAYWELPFGEEPDESLDSDQWAEKMGAILLDAARIRLRADVPVGAYLSGGIDSTYIATLVKNNFNNHLNTFSVTFTDQRFDEASFQKRAVDAIKTGHKSVQCSEEDIGRIFPDIIRHTETPVLRTAPSPLCLLSKLVRESDFKVVLTGEGADEFFAGYNIFKEDRVRRFWSKHPDSKMRPELLKKLYPYIFKGAEKNAAFLTAFFKKEITRTESPVYSHLLRWRNTSRIKGFFSRDLSSEIQGLDQFVEKYSKTLPDTFMSWSPLSRAQYTESSLFLSNYLLSSQGDRMAMANSVEGRFPFLDHRVIEEAVKIPPGIRINGLTEKYILKKAARGVIPDALIDRAKQPYRAPISRCFFGKNAPDYVMELLSENSIKKSNYFDHGKVSRLVEKCTRDNGKLLSERENMAIVGILSTQLIDHFFIRNFVEKPTVQREHKMVSQK